jgi:hypothetical protein
VRYPQEDLSSRCNERKVGEGVGEKRNMVGGRAGTIYFRNLDE